jgi:hypothetical protein
VPPMYVRVGSRWNSGHSLPFSVGGMTVRATGSHSTGRATGGKSWSGALPGMDRIVGGYKRFVKPVSAAGFEAQTLSAKFLGNCLLAIHVAGYEEVIYISSWLGNTTDS